LLFSFIHLKSVHTAADLGADRTRQIGRAVGAWISDQLVTAAAYHARVPSFLGPDGELFPKTTSCAMKMIEAIQLKLASRLSGVSDNATSAKLALEITSDV